ncbi:ESPR-type extended signal peptide-containing protein [Ralstonia soli]|uniref:YadA-like family protein n=1 Tax=Ralstonia soli TaxID=2953896 RepID=A0ABT1AGX9_9RALS|nr:ESPR-type extended signal peptide-containing protein [Ralstonia soli]MCO5397571.1 YadA-like family protein [Ralstonia soli]
MNKTYRTIFNAATGTWAAASELAKGRKKSSKSAVVLAAAALLALPGAAFAADSADDEENDEAKTELVIPNAAPKMKTSGFGTESIGTMATLDDTFIKVSGSVASTASNGTPVDGAILNPTWTSGTTLIGTAIGNGAAGTYGGTAVGDHAVTGGFYGVAVGAYSSAGSHATAIGPSAMATGSDSFAAGVNARAETGNSVAIGNRAYVNTGANSVAIGVNANVSQANSTAIGVNANVNQANGTAMGSGATISNNGTNLARNALALGNGATVTATTTSGADNGVALGNAARVTANNAVALGGSSVADQANTVSVGTTVAGGQRRIVNLAAGTANTDAVNLGQMNTALSTKVDNNLVKVGGATDAMVSGHANNIAIGNGAQSTSAAGGSPSMAFGNDARATGNSGAMAFGSASRATGATSTAFGIRATVDANAAGGMAFGTDANVLGYTDGGAITNNANGSIAIGGGARVTATAAGNANNSVALGNGANVSAANAVALGAGSAATVANTVSVGNATTQRRVVNMAAGTAPTDAVNVSQLAPVVTALGGGATINPDGSVTGPTYNLANGTGTPATTIGDAFSQLDGALTTTNGRVGDLEGKLGSGTIGLVQQAGAGQKLTVGKDTDGTEVDFHNNTSATRTLTGVTAGAVAAGSTEAINGSQLHAVSTSVADAIGAGSTVNPDGSITAPSFTVGDGMGGTTTVHNVGAVVTNLNDRVTGNETAIGDIRSELGSGTVGLVQQAGAGQKLTVGKDTDGAEVDFTGTAGTRKLTGVTAGAVATGSTEAINGAQLHAVSTSVADAIGAGSTVNVDGSISAPSFTVGDGAGGTTVVHNVGAVVSNLDGRVTGNETAIGDIRSELGSGALGLVRQATPTGDVTVAAGTGGTAVNFTGTDGVRVLSGIGAGIGNNDAVSVGQLKSVIGYNLVDPLDPLMAVRYDDASMKSVTFGGDPMFGTVLNNVGAGLIAAGSMQAVNGGQLFDMQAKYDGLIGDLDGRVGKIESGIADGSIGGPGTGTPEGSVPSPGKGDGSTAVGAGSDASGKNSSAIGNGAVASGSGSSAVGNGAVASGENSTALGQGAQASNNNSVAIGAGSTTSRDNEVSFGSPGNERILSNVADGVRDTDAVNVRQMNNAIGGLNNKIDSNHRDAMGGVAAAMAVAGLPQSSMPGKTFMAIAGSTYGGEQGTAIGASYMSQNGKWVVKGAMNTSSRGEVGAVVGGGFYW